MYAIKEWCDTDVLVFYHLTCLKHCVRVFWKQVKVCSLCHFSIVWVEYRVEVVKRIFGIFFLIVQYQILRLLMSSSTSFLLARLGNKYLIHKIIEEINLSCEKLRCLLNNKCCFTEVYILNQLISDLNYELVQEWFNVNLPYLGQILNRFHKACNRKLGKGILRFQCLRHV